MGERNQEIQAEFDRYADQYHQSLKDPIRDAFTAGADFFHKRKLDVIRKYFREHNRDTRQMAWLDVGCGAGDLLALGAEHFREASGCDPSASMLKVAAVGRLRRQEVAHELPYESAMFDFVTAVCVYHHVEFTNREPLTREIARVLRPGGVFAMIEHNPFNPATQLIVRRCPVDADANLLSSRLSRRIARDCGLVPMKTRYFLYLPENLYNLPKLSTLEDALDWVPAGGQYAVFSRKV